MEQGELVQWRGVPERGQHEEANSAVRQEAKKPQK